HKPAMGTTRAERNRAIDNCLRGFDVLAAEIAKCEGGDSKRLWIAGSSLKRSVRKIHAVAARCLTILSPTIDVELGLDSGGPCKGGSILGFPLDRVFKQVSG